MGVDLSDPEGRWVYYSPMSWHPTSQKAMWNEGLSLTLGYRSSMMTMTVELTEDSHGTTSYNGTTIDVADNTAGLPWERSSRTAHPPAK